MYREHVLLSLSLLIGMLFIIDLYIAAMYMNKPSDKKRDSRGDREQYNPFPVADIITPISIPRGRDTEFGFDLRRSPQDATFFKYFFYPYRGHLTVLLPADKLKSLRTSTNEQDILDYVVKKIMEESSFQQKRRSQFYSDDPFLKSNYLGEEVEEGAIWVNEEILMRLSENQNPSGSSSFENSLKRQKRSSSIMNGMHLTSLKLLRINQEKIKTLIASSSISNAPIWRKMEPSKLNVKSSLSDRRVDWGWNWNLKSLLKNSNYNEM